MLGGRHKPRHDVWTKSKRLILRFIGKFMARHKVTDLVGLLSIVLKLVKSIVWNYRLGNAFHAIYFLFPNS